MYVARVRSGFVPASRRQVFEKIRHLASPTMPFVNLPDTHKFRWGDELTADKMLRTCANGELPEFVIIVDSGASTAEGDFLFRARNPAVPRRNIISCSEAEVSQRTTPGLYAAPSCGIRPRKNRK